MAGLLRRKRQIAVELETVEGTAETPAVGDATQLVYNPSFNPEIDVFERNPAQASLTTLIGLPGVQLFRGTWETEIKGANDTASPPDVTTVPSWGPSLQACSYQVETVSQSVLSAGGSGTFLDGETIVATVSPGQTAVIYKNLDLTSPPLPGPLLFVQGSTPIDPADAVTGQTSGATATLSGAITDYGLMYRPTSDNNPINSATVTSFEDGVKKTFKGSRGNATFNGTVGEPAFWAFEFLGVFGSVVDDGLLSPVVYELLTPPQLLGISLSLHPTETAGASLLFENISFSTNNDLVPRLSANDSAGALSVKIPTRSPGGSMNPEMETVAQFDFLNRFIGANSGELFWQLGTSQGNIVEFYSATTVITGVTDEDRNGIAVAGLTFGLHKANVNSAGDDEIKVVVR